MPPGAEFPDQVKIFEEEYEEEALETPEEIAGSAEEEAPEAEVKPEEEETEQ